MKNDAPITQWLSYLETIFSSLTVGEIIPILTDLGFQDSQFRSDEWGGTFHKLTDLHLNPTVYDVPGNELRLAFYGGPPGADQWFDGNMVMWVLDAVLHEFVTGDDAVAMAIVHDVEDIWNTDCENTWDEEIDSIWDEVGA